MPAMPWRAERAVTEIAPPAPSSRRPPGPEPPPAQRRDTRPLQFLNSMRAYTGHEIFSILQKFFSRLAYADRHVNRKKFRQPQQKIARNLATALQVR
ncbi:hypothetical protein WKW79_02180 [Variovorax robiniae]|uniref:Uncharacterized protein n=1 Tax=Variovorax robiniae TaxID=1836199 RepID=A0ABU8X3W0_9BURK